MNKRVKSLCYSGFGERKILQKNEKNPLNGTFCHSSLFLMKNSCFLDQNPERVENDDGKKEYSQRKNKK